MGYCELDIYVECFGPDSDGFVRVPRREVAESYAAGDLITVTDGEVLGFARVVSIEGDAETGWSVLEVLAGTAADQAAELLEVTYDEWCDAVED